MTDDAQTSTADTAPDTTADGTTTDSARDAPQAGKPQEPDYKAEADKWKALARKHEAAAKERAKANADAAKELEELRAAQMSESEKAIAAAKAEGRAEAEQQFAAQRMQVAETTVSALFRAQLTFRGKSAEEADGLLEAIAPSRFLDDEGSPDTDKITAFVDRLVPAQPDTFPDLGQGRRGGPTEPDARPGMDRIQQALAKRYGNK